MPKKPEMTEEEANKILFQSLVETAAALGFPETIWTVKDGQPLSFTFAREGQHSAFLETALGHMQEGGMIDDVYVTAKEESRN